jgi:two-component system, OmpR family, response regulator BaeR
MIDAPRSLHSILIVEDDFKIADMVANYLHAHGYQTHHVADGGEALAAFESLAPDLILLDLMLPNMDGIEICQRIRQTSHVPIIMVTAKVEEVDRLLGLDLGADDYVCKPFSPRELVARIKALLRRAQATRLAASQPPQAAQEPSLGFMLFMDELRLTWNTRTVPLTPVEFRLFKLLHAKPGHVFSRQRLLDALHSDYRDTTDRVVDSHIKNLRKKLDAAGTPEGCIASVYGVGYRFELD